MEQPFSPSRSKAAATEVTVKVWSFIRAAPPFASVLETEHQVRHTALQVNSRIPTVEIGKGMRWVLWKMPAQSAICFEVIGLPLNYQKSHRALQWSALRKRITSQS